MTWWPGWDSIDDANWWSHLWFWLGIACLVALAGAEVISHIYGLRKDELVAAAERTATEQRQRDADAAEARRKADVEAVQKQLSEADKKVADLQIQQAPRHLSPAQQGELIRVLSPFAGQKVQLSTMANSNEPKDFALDFLSVFRGAKWDDGNLIHYMVIAGADLVGVSVSVNPQDANNQSAIAPAVNALVLALVRMSLMPAMQVVPNAGTPVGAISLTIGVKPPPFAR
jgi:hypothetical protein